MKKELTRRREALVGSMDRWLPELLLVAVAAAQIVTAHVHDLSPWKGGGFGMFAATDGPGMRVISAYGRGSDGHDYRLDALSAVDDATGRRIRSFPREADLRALAYALAASEFVPSGTVLQAALDRLQEENPGTKLGLRLAPLFERPTYRVRKPQDPPLESDAVPRLRSVSVQAWRLRWDHARIRLRAEPLSRSIEVPVAP